MFPLDLLMNTFINYHNQIDSNTLIIVYFSLFMSGRFLHSRQQMNGECIYPYDLISVIHAVIIICQKKRQTTSQSKSAKLKSYNNNDNFIFC